MRYRYKKYPDVDAVQHFDSPEEFEKHNHLIPMWMLEAVKDGRIYTDEKNDTYVKLMVIDIKVYNTNWIIKMDNILHVMSDYDFQLKFERVPNSEMRIRCAAIRYNGLIYIGKSHSEIGNRMRADKVCDKIPGGDDQGFVTECGIFVMRRPAMAIAIRAGQVKDGETLSKHDLFSEDLKEVK